MYTFEELSYMKKEQELRIAELELMIENRRIGGFLNLSEVEKALKFEKSELEKIENEIKSRKGISI
jgi:hypothetical protein